MQAGFSKYLFRSFTSRVLYYASVLILNICIARFFESDGSGVFNYLVSVLSLVVLIASLSLDSAINYLLSKQSITISNVRLFSIAWTVMISLLYFIIPELPGVVGNESRQFFTEFAIVYVGGNILITILQSAFHAKFDFVLPAIIASGINFIFIGLLLYNDANGLSSSVNEFWEFYSFGFLFQGILMWLLLSKHDRSLKMRWMSAASLRSMFRYAVVALIANLVFFLMYRVDYWFVHRYCTAEQLGNYIQVSKLAQFFLIIPASIAAVIFPATAMGQLDIGEKLQLLSRVISTFFTGVLLFLIVTGYWLFPFIFGNTFNGMYTSFLLLTPGILALVIIALIAAYFGGNNQVEVNLKSALIGLMLIIIGDIVFIPLFDIRAAAAVSSVSYLAGLYYSFYRFHLVQRGSLLDFVWMRKSDWKRMKEVMRRGSSPPRYKVNNPKDAIRES